MKKTGMTIVLALSMSFAGHVSASDVWYTQYDNVPLSINLSEGLNPIRWPFEGYEKCRVPIGTKLLIRERTPNGWALQWTGGWPDCEQKRTYFVNPDDIVSAQVWQRNFQHVNKKVFTNGRWGNDVPVFKTRGSYYSARASMDREGHYRRQSGSVACQIKVGTAVQFNPYRNWGVGEVKIRNCSGWMDRAVIQ